MLKTTFDIKRDNTFLENGIICKNCQYVGYGIVDWPRLKLLKEKVFYYFCNNHSCKVDILHIDHVHKECKYNNKPKLLIGWLYSDFSSGGRVCNVESVIKHTNNHWSLTNIRYHVYGSLVKQSELKQKIISLYNGNPCPCKC